MPVIAAFAVPHPPLIIPEVGHGRERGIQATIDAYTEVGHRIAALAPDTIVISSPHSTSYLDYLHISGGTGAHGTFAQFGDRADGSRVAMLRFGPQASQLVIEKGRRNLCHYETGYGSVTLGVTADGIECGLNRKGGTARFSYLLDGDVSTLISKNSLEVTVTHVN